MVRLLRRLLRDSRGNMVLIAAGMLVAVVAVGFGLDYGRAVALQAQLAAAGDAAAMAAVSQPVLALDDVGAGSVATSLFVGQVSGLAGLVFDPASGLRVTVSDGAGGRQAAVRWSAAYATRFGGIFGVGTLPVSGSASASAAGAANGNFTLVLAPASQDLTLAAQALDPVARQLAGQNGVTYALRIAPGGGGAAGGGGYAALLAAAGDGIAAPGDGALPSGAQAVLVLMTDGSPGVPSDADLAACAAIKSRGIVLAVLLAPPVPVVGAQLAGGLACASPQMGGAPLFLQRAPGQSSADALAALFAMAAANARLVH